MMNILLYISTIRGGGAARVMVNLANGLVKRGCHITFVTNFPDIHEYKLNNDIRRICIEEMENRGNILCKNISRIIKLRKIIKKEKPDVCIAFMRENNFRLIIATRGLNTKTIISIRNDPNREYRTKFSKKTADILYPKANFIVFQTEEARSSFTKEIFKKSKVIANQVEEKFFNQSKESGEYLIACGRLSKQKNIPMMIEAFAKVLVTFPDEILRIYGDGELKDSLERMVKELGIEKSVQFMGFNTEIEKCYKKAKILLLSSDYEGMPNVVLEALATGTPVISTDCPCGGPKTVIKNRVNGFLIPVGDTREMSRAIIELLENDDLRTEMTINARRMALEYSPKVVMDNWLKLINNAIKE